MSARVFLNDTLVGELRPNSASTEASFEFDFAYAAAAARPILGRWFEDKLIDPPRSFRGSPLPNYFRNLLPEGALRKIIQRRIGQSSLPEYTMLLRVGRNLPGAVRVVSDELDEGPLEASERTARTPGDPFGFALTGMQPKLALSQHDDRLTVPVEGADGHWIAKFGSPAFQHLVENEHAMLDWATKCGLTVPEHRLIPGTDIDGLPEDFEPNQRVLVVRRFDRVALENRIHQEDFAQVFDIAPEERYAYESLDLGWANYGSIAAVIRAVCGANDFREYMRRLVFMVLSGNGDAHLKNWALVYANGLKASLAPAYDFVSTIVYPSIPTHTALRWCDPGTPTIEKPKSMAEVTIEDILGAASLTEGEGTAELADDLEAFCAEVRSTWERVASDAPTIVRDRVTAHLLAAKL